ncbi:MAG: DMT family transporter [Anaerolineales bacterium]|nr:DMT family transporter [Anaerolineales bacterium]
MNSSPATSTRSGFLRLHLAVLLFGFSGLLGAIIRADPAVIVFGRTFSAAVALFAYLLLVRARLLIRPCRDILALSLAGLLLAAHWFAFFQSVRVSSVAAALIGFAAYPVWIALLEPLAFRERPAGIDYAAAVLAAAGLALAAPGRDVSDPATQGILWGLAAGVSFAVLALFNRKLVQTHPPLTVAFYQLGFAAAAGLPWAAGSEAAPDARDLAWLLVLGIFCTAVAQTLYIGSLRHLPARTAGVVVGLEPVYGIFLAWILLGEIPGAGTLLGGAVILGAVYLAMVGKGKPA